MSHSADGVAALAPEEGRLALTIQRNDHGGVRVSGEAVDDDGEGNRLQFQFDLEVSAIPPIRDALERVLAVFPVVAAPEV